MTKRRQVEVPLDDDFLRDVEPDEQDRRERDVADAKVVAAAAKRRVAERLVAKSAS